MARPFQICYFWQETILARPLRSTPILRPEGLHRVQENPGEIPDRVGYAQVNFAATDLADGGGKQARHAFAGIELRVRHIGGQHGWLAARKPASTPRAVTVGLPSRVVKDAQTAPDLSIRAAHRAVFPAKFALHRQSFTCQEVVAATNLGSRSLVSDVSM
jgi:hypothetical protein